MSGPVKSNYRLERIASEICVSDLTDGFCNPRGKPNCKCWKYARLAVTGLSRSANPLLEEVFPGFLDEYRRAKLEQFCNAILTKRDRLTEEHEAWRKEKGDHAE